MRPTIKPYGFVKEDKEDEFFKIGDRYFIRTKYGGVIETTKEYWESYMGVRE